MSEQRNILIVEDDTAFADFVRAAVESLGHKGIVVATGAAALDAYRSHRPDLVFLDLLLPGRDGFKVCEDIRREPKGAEVPVVMMTGIYKKASYEKEAVERLKASDYLIKPFGVREVWGAIERALGPSVAKGGGRIASPAASGWSLQETPLVCQLAEHLRMKSDGVLFVRGHDATFVLYLREGAPVFVRSSDPTDRLDRVIARTTRVPESGIAECVRESRESRGRKRLGDVLVDRRLLSRDEIEIALQLQLRLILNRAFQLEKGCCLFVAGEHPTEEDVLLQAHPRALLVRGARSTSMAAARAHLPAGGSTLIKAQGWEALVADLNLKEDEIRLLQLCDGSMTVERFLGTAAVCGHDGPRILLALQCAGLAWDIPAEKPVPRARPATGALDVAPWRSRPLGALISELYRRRGSGRLQVTLAEGEPPRVLHFRDGDLVAVESSMPEDRVGAMLVKMQVVEAGIIDEITEALGPEAPDAMVVRALVDRELLSPTEGYWAAVYQAHGSVHALLPEVPLRMEWTPGDLEPHVIPLPDVPTIELALNGVRALDAATVREMMPPAGTRAVASRTVTAEGTPLSGGEQAILGRLGGGQEIAAFCAGAEEPATRARSVLALVQLGLVELTTASGAPCEEPAPPTEAAEDAAAARDEPDGEAGPEVDLEEALIMEFTAPPRAAAAPAPAAEAAPQEPAREAEAEAAVAEPFDEVQRRLRELRPTLKALRAGFDGTDRRVQVDRAKMAELLDELLDILALARRLEVLQKSPRRREREGTTVS